MVEITAAPYAFPRDPCAAALVISDMQRDFPEPGGFGAVLGNGAGRRRMRVRHETLAIRRRNGLTADATHSPEDSIHHARAA